MLVEVTRGKRYGSFLTKLPPNHYQYKLGTIRNVEQNGVRYELDISDIMDWYVYFGFKEIARTELYNLIKRDDVIFDVGANIGGTTLNFAKLAGTNGRVYSFEPDPINYKSIQKNLSLNNFNNIVLNKIGLGNKSGDFKIYTVDEKNKGMNRILENSKNENGEYVKVITIDEFVRGNKIDNINLIKIDVEGFEFNVLKGAEMVLNDFHPILFVELDNQNLIEQETSAVELIAYLLSFGYEIFHAETNELITPELDFTHCHYDIVAKYIS